MAPGQLLIATVLVGLAATGLAALVRALPLPTAWVQRKPLACVACMAGHASWIMLLGAWLTGQLHGLELAQLPVVYFGATGLGAMLLGQTGLFVPPVNLDFTPLDEEQ